MIGQASQDAPNPASPHGFTPQFLQALAERARPGAGAVLSSDQANPAHECASLGEARSALSRIPTLDLAASHTRRRIVNPVELEPELSRAA